MPTRDWTTPALRLVSVGHNTPSTTLYSEYRQRASTLIAALKSLVTNKLFYYFKLFSSVIPKLTHIHFLLINRWQRDSLVYNVGGVA